MRVLDRERLAQNMEQIACGDMEAHKVFGSAYSVRQGDEIVYEKSFGAALKAVISG